MTSDRTCKKCGVTKPVSGFSKNSNRKDGLEWKCKVCIGQMAKVYRLGHLDQITASQRKWDAANQDKVRVARRKAVQKFRDNNPKVIYAHSQVSYAIATNRIEKLPCFICGEENTEAHHPDYSAPLDVVWLCKEHHSELHAEHKRYNTGVSNEHHA